MMKNVFLSVFEISVSASFVIFVLLVLSPYLNKRYAAKWKYLIWIAIALRLAIPFHFNLPDRALVITVPEQVITPIAVDTENTVPIMLNKEADPVAVTILDIIMYLWGSGVVLFVSVPLFCYWHYKHKLMANALPIEEDRILRQIGRLSGELGIKPTIQVVRDFNAGSPMMIGFLKPVLVLPDDNCSEEEMYFVLKHELTHYKHRDIYFKLLFVFVNAIHWFNPLVYIMRKEAVVDMEMYCDESVIRQSGITERKAYTETLFSTMSRQYKKGTALTTQFYGGKKIMKKRFKNVLLKTNRKNGWIVCVCAVCLTLMSGAMVGCSAIERPPYEVQDMHTNSGENLSADALEIKNLAEEVFKAYYSGDIGEVQKLLPKTYDWDIDVYEGIGTISDITLKGLPEAGELPEGTAIALSVEHRNSDFDDMLVYLTIELIKQNGRWEVQFYGLEG